MYSPFIITVTLDSRVIERIQVSDSHELYDQLEWLKQDYPEHTITYVSGVTISHGVRQYPFRRPSAGERPESTTPADGAVVSPTKA